MLRKPHIKGKGLSSKTVPGAAVNLAGSTPWGSSGIAERRAVDFNETSTNLCVQNVAAPFCLFNPTLSGMWTVPHFLCCQMSRCATWSGKGRGVGNHLVGEGRRLLRKRLTDHLQDRSRGLEESHVSAMASPWSWDVMRMYQNVDGWLSNRIYRYLYRDISRL